MENTEYSPTLINKIANSWEYKISKQAVQGAKWITILAAFSVVGDVEASIKDFTSNPDDLMYLRELADGWVASMKFNAEQNFRNVGEALKLPIIAIATWKIIKGLRFVAAAVGGKLGERLASDADNIDADERTHFIADEEGVYLGDKKTLSKARETGSLFVPTTEKSPSGVVTRVLRRISPKGVEREDLPNFDDQNLGFSNK